MVRQQMTSADTLDRGRESFRRQAWGDSYDQLSAVDHETPLELEDLERLAVAAYLTGRDGDSADVWARAHHECLRLGDGARAARCAFWLARARRLLDGHQPCVEQGYLLVPIALQSIGEGDAATAHATFSEAANIGDRFRDGPPPLAL